jgi:hypothetical protein
MRPMFRTAAVGLLSVLAACGGSGDGSGGGGLGLDGEFHVASIGGRFDTAPDVEAIFGRATVDGDASTVTFDITVNGEGTVGSGTEVLPARLDADGTFALLTQDMSGPTDGLRGALADDESVIVLGSVSSGSRPAIFVKIRESSAAAASNLAGGYHLVVLRHEPKVSGLVGQATFDGAGTGQILAGATVNDEGVISAVPFPYPLTYAIAADGGATLQFFANDHPGGLRQGGDLLAVAGSEQAGGFPTILVFLRAATTASVATFSGTYAMVELRYAASITTFSSITATAQADGAGAFSFAGTQNEEGTIAPILGNSTYTVAADGALTIDSIRGAVSPDGRFAVLGTVGANFGPSIRLLVRR